MITTLSLLVRLLLSVTLILNGSAGTMAAAQVMAGHDGRMANSGAVHDQSNDDTRSSAAQPCHPMPGAAAANAPVVTAAPGPHHASDCCASTDCRNRCAQHCAASVNAMAFEQIVIIPRAGLVPTLYTALVSQPLVQLIRPPIS